MKNFVTLPTKKKAALLFCVRVCVCVCACIYSVSQFDVKLTFLTFRRSHFQEVHIKHGD